MQQNTCGPCNSTPRSQHADPPAARAWRASPLTSAARRRGRSGGGGTCAATLSTDIFSCRSARYCRRGRGGIGVIMNGLSAGPFLFLGKQAVATKEDMQLGHVQHGAAALQRGSPAAQAARCSGSSPAEGLPCSAALPGCPPTPPPGCRASGTGAAAAPERCPGWLQQQRWRRSRGPAVSMAAQHGSAKQQAVEWQRQLGSAQCSLAASLAARLTCVEGPAGRRHAPKLRKQPGQHHGPIALQYLHAHGLQAVRGVPKGR